jgi:hypothetical protein
MSDKPKEPEFCNTCGQRWHSQKDVEEGCEPLDESPPKAPERVCNYCGVLDSKGTAENGDHVSSYGCVRALHGEIARIERELEIAEGKRVKFSPPDPSRDEAMRAYIEVMERAERNRIREWAAENSVDSLNADMRGGDYVHYLDLLRALLGPDRVVRGEEKP